MNYSSELYLTILKTTLKLIKTNKIKNWLKKIFLKRRF